MTNDDGDETDLDENQMEQGCKLHVDGRVGNDSTDDDDNPSESNSSDDEYDPFV